jgi:hypothetical protein
VPNLCASAGFFLGGKTVGPTSTCSEGGKHDFSSSKGDAAGILSGLDIGELVSLVFWRMDARDGFLEDGCSGWLRITEGLVRVQAVLRSHLDFLGFSLGWNSGLSHGWFNAVSKAFLSNTS